VDEHGDVPLLVNLLEVEKSAHHNPLDDGHASGTAPLSKVAMGIGESEAEGGVAQARLWAFAAKEWVKEGAGASASDS
jgi:hypothetical protein